MNIWLNEQNHQREHTLVSATYAGGIYTSNTVFCLFEPNAEGMQADSFPVESSIYYGTRVGRPYPICCLQTPDSVPVHSREERIAYIKERRREDLGQDTSPELLERILWEQENGGDGPSLAKIMNELAALHPVKDTAHQSLPVLPLLPNITQAINMGATDSRAVLVLVRPERAAPTIAAPMDEIARRLLFEKGIVGRMHAVVATPTEWADAKAAGKVVGGELETGMMLLRPGFFGRSAEVQTEIHASACLGETRASLAQALKLFRDTWRKPDRAQLIKKGVADGITWREWDPKAKCMSDVPPNRKMDGPLGHVADGRR